MPVNCAQEGSPGEALYQREQYQKGGIAKKYWDYRDKIILENIGKDSQVILDAGCGEGITLEKICRRFGERRVSGIDIMDENIAICQQHGLPARKGDLYHLEMPDNSVDCCVLSEVIEHLEEPEAALLEMKRILKPGGRLIIVFPNDLVFKLARIATMKFKEAFYDAGHCRQWTPGDMKKQLTETGLKVERTRNTPFFFWPMSLHCVVVSRKPLLGSDAPAIPTKPRGEPTK